jgi:hypothetical protein
LGNQGSRTRPGGPAMRTQGHHPGRVARSGAQIWMACIGANEPTTRPGHARSGPAFPGASPVSCAAAKMPWASGSDHDVPCGFVRGYFQGASARRR